LDQTTQGRLSRQDALLQQEMAKETERRRQKDLERIKAALLRVDTDDYGYCISCDEEISAARLKLDPAIITCIDCAK
jgi:DnaK suppressor protein